MNDYWNDPPDDDPPPKRHLTIEALEKAAEMLMEDFRKAYGDDENRCRTCGKPTECIYCSTECTPDCPHGNRPDNCDHCDYLADIAFDAARER